MIIGLNLNELGNPIRFNKHGFKEWTAIPGDQYEVTGIDVNGKRFKRVYSDWGAARAINLYRGTKWLKRGAKRYRIVSTYN